MATILQAAGDAVDSLGNHMHHTAKKVGNRVEVTTDHYLPPDRREQTLEKFRHYARHNPKTAAFLATQGVLTGLPLVLFFAFAATTLLVSLSTCLFFGILAALAFSSFVLGFALLFVVPTVFIASCSATFIFIWGLVGYIILRRFNEGEAPAKPGTRVGDALQTLTGGRSAYYFDDQAHAQGTRASGKGGQNGAPVGAAVGGTDGTGGTGRPHHRLSAPHGHGGLVNGANRSVESERKWADGMMTQPVKSNMDGVSEETQPVIVNQGDANTGYGAPPGPLGDFSASRVAH